jgi:hypothetical protein
MTALRRAAICGQREHHKKCHSHKAPYCGAFGACRAGPTSMRGRCRASHMSNSCAGNAAASRGYSSFRRPSRRPFRGMDLAGKIPPGRERWPGIARTRNSRSSKRPVGSSRTMHRHRHRCWSARSRPARVAQERLLAWLPPQQSNAWRANIFQADCAAPR